MSTILVQNILHTRSSLFVSVRRAVKVHFKGHAVVKDSAIEHLNSALRIVVDLELHNADKEIKK